MAKDFVTRTFVSFSWFYLQKGWSFIQKALSTVEQSGDQKLAWRFQRFFKFWDLSSSNSDNHLRWWLKSSEGLKRDDNLRSKSSSTSHSSASWELSNNRKAPETFKSPNFPTLPASINELAKLLCERKTTFFFVVKDVTSQLSRFMLRERDELGEDKKVERILFTVAI